MKNKKDVSKFKKMVRLITASAKKNVKPNGKISKKEKAIVVSFEGMIAQS